MAIFTRSLSDPLASLVKKIDAKAGSFKGRGKSPLRSFVVLLSEDPDADEKKLVEFAKKHGIKNVPLTLFDGIAGPRRYKIAKDAENTFVFWSKKKVKANHAFGKDQFKSDDVDKVVKSTSKILD